LTPFVVKRARKRRDDAASALNVAPDLTRYAGIVPCGIRDAGITSLAALGRNVSLDEVDGALRAAFERRFGATERG